MANIIETGHTSEREREEDFGKNHVRSFTAFPKQVAPFQIKSSEKHKCPDAVSVEFIFRAEMCVGNSVQYRLKGNNINLYRGEDQVDEVIAACRWKVCESCSLQTCPSWSDLKKSWNAARIWVSVKPTLSRLCTEAWP